MNILRSRREKLLSSLLKGIGNKWIGPLLLLTTIDVIKLKDCAFRAQ